MHTCILLHGLKRSWHSSHRVLDGWIPCNKNTPSMHHPQRWNVTTSVFGLKQKTKNMVTYKQKSYKKLLTQRWSWEHRRRRTRFSGLGVYCYLSPVRPVGMAVVEWPLSMQRFCQKSIRKTWHFLGSLFQSVIVKILSCYCYSICTSLFTIHAFLFVNKMHLQRVYVCCDGMFTTVGKGCKRVSNFLDCLPDTSLVDSCHWPS